MLSKTELFGYTLFISFHKLLLFPAYKSTDFEVHRNWLAITHNLPLSEWYYADHSQWTLDYPPLFAYMEYLFSVIAAGVDGRIVEIDNLEYDATTCVYFQRLTVVVSDFALAFAAYKWSSLLKVDDHVSKVGVILLLLANAGLIIVDHIHFQYNGVMFGILLLSMYYIVVGNEIVGSILFASLLNLKHIFIYVAPAFGIYLLKCYCTKGKRFSIVKFVQLGLIVTFVFALSFGPFVNHLPQVFSRLFPFKRGLTHAYWAPNIWALYNFLDRALFALKAKLVGIDDDSAYAAADCFSKGLVQVCDHVVLPNIQPLHTFVLTVLAMLPCIFLLFFQTSKSKMASLNRFIRAVQLCSLCSFMFGYHVHEKAIIMTIIPTTLLAFLGGPGDQALFFVMQYIGHYSLFPLLYEPFVVAIRFLIWIFYSLMCLNFVKPCQLFLKNHELVNKKVFVVACYAYTLSLMLSELLFTLFFPLSRFNVSHPFLPLMCTSVLCGIGLLGCLIYSYKLFLQNEINLFKLGKVCMDKQQ